MKSIKLLLLALIAVFAVNQSYADLSHFSYTEGDPTNSMIIAITGTADPSLDGTTLETGDEIAVFNDNGDCVGAIVWENEATYLTAWGKSGSTPGYESGDELIYRIWDQSADKEYDNITVEHRDVDSVVIAGLFDNTVPYIKLTDFDAVSTPKTPVLISPADMAEGIYLTGVVKWNAVLNADSYSLMIAKTDDFSSDVVVNESGLTSDQYAYTLADYDTKYYWKVKATDDTDGDSEWSDVWEFTTYNGETKEVELTMYLRGLWDGSEHEPVAISIELREGDGLMSSTLVKRLPALIDENGTASANFGQVEDGDYYVVARASGFLPLAIDGTVALSTSGISHNFTTASTQAVIGTTVMIQNGDSDWEARAGDINLDRGVQPSDLNSLVESFGKNAATFIPAP